MGETDSSAARTEVVVDHGWKVWVGVGLGVAAVVVWSYVWASLDVRLLDRLWDSAASDADFVAANDTVTALRVVAFWGAWLLSIASVVVVWRTREGASRSTVALRMAPAAVGIALLLAHLAQVL